MIIYPLFIILFVVDLLLFANTLIADFGILGVFISTMLMNATIILPLPGDLVVFSAGALANNSIFFNPFSIGIVAGIGAAIGELTAWAVGWETDHLILKKRHGKIYKQAEKFFKKHGFVGIAFFSLTPLPMDVMGLLAGALRYDPIKFFLATLLGKIPRNLLLAYAGFAGMTIVLNAFQFKFF